MKNVTMVIGGAALSLVVGCAFRPEAMPIMPRDNAVYVDGGAPKSLNVKESRAKVAVYAVTEKNAEFKSVAEALDNALNDKLSAYAFFEIVDRKSTRALIDEQFRTAADPTAISIEQVPADYIIFARLVSLNVKEAQPQYDRKGRQIIQGGFSASAQFDFKWVGVESKKVVMTKLSEPVSSFGQTKEDAVAGMQNSAATAAAEFCQAISAKYAPPARVLQTRGDCEAARISIGKNYGLTEGVIVKFYEIVDNSSLGGGKRDENDVGRGTVKIVDPTAAWVRVHNHDKVAVRKGVYVRPLEEKSDALGELPIVGN